MITALTGESGKFAVKSIQVAPEVVVFQTWPVPPVKPITVTYAVAPVWSNGSRATPEIGNWLGLMLPCGPFSATPAKLRAQVWRWS
jgi:hypothetical protein